MAIGNGYVNTRPHMLTDLHKHRRSCRHRRWELAREAVMREVGMPQLLKVGTRPGPLGKLTCSQASVEQAITEAAAHSKPIIAAANAKPIIAAAHAKPIIRRHQKASVSTVTSNSSTGLNAATPMFLHTRQLVVVNAKQS